jgi:eukaryotic-like serine/threonine-protein kinase
MSTSPSEPSSTPDPTTGEWRLGSWLSGKYRLDAVLGAGGMAVVYAATHRNKKRVAVKMLLEPLSSRLDVRARFLREGYVANTVEHVGAVSVFDDDVAEDGTAYLVMELLQGQTVQEACKNAGGRLSIPSTLCIAHQVLDTLAAAHAKNIVHRDIKPANLFMTQQGQLKILDFGIARLREADSNETQTLAGVSMGTPAFMAPEQAMGTTSEVDAQSDIWSVGATLFRLLSGRKVHVGETSQHLIMLAAMTPAVPLASVAPEVDPRVTAIVDRALAFAKKDRWPSAVAMRDEVAAVYRALYGEPAPASLVTDAGSVFGAKTELHLRSPSAGPLSAEATGPSSIVTGSALARSREASSATTADPVSSGPRVQRERRRRLAPIIAAAVLGAGVAVVAAVGLSRHADAPAPAAPPASTSPAATTPPQEPTTTDSKGAPLPPPTSQVEPPEAGIANSPSGTSASPGPPGARPRKPPSTPPARGNGSSPPPATDFDRQ